MSTPRAVQRRSAPHWAAVRALPAWLCLLATLACGPLRLGAQSSETLEFEVKAAMIYNFTRFVEWPVEAFSDAKAPFVVALLGDDALGRFVETAMKDKSVAGHPIHCRRVQSVPSGEPYHLLLLPRGEKRHVAEYLRAAARAGVLTVGDTEGFAAAGGVIGITLDGKKARFDVNLDSAARAKLTVSSKLLRLARTVLERSGGRS